MLISSGIVFAQVNTQVVDITPDETMPSDWVPRGDGTILLEDMKNVISKSSGTTPEKILEGIRTGDENVLLNVYYEELDAAMNVLALESKLRRDEIEGLFSDPLTRALLEVPESPEIRLKVINALYSGVINADPRIRLICIKMLRRLIPNIDMLTITDTVLDIETVLVDVYRFNYNGTSDLKHQAFVELAKLQRFISRNLLVQRILKGEKEVFVNMSEAVFNLLAKPIDNEGFSNIPINFLGESELPVIMAGFNTNENPEMKKELLKALLRILRENTTSDTGKKQIFEFLKANQYLHFLVVNIKDEELEKVPVDVLIKVFTLKNGEVTPCYTQDNPYAYNDRYDLPNPVTFQRPRLETSPIRYGIEYQYSPEHVLPNTSSSTAPTTASEAGKESIPLEENKNKTEFPNQYIFEEEMQNQIIDN